MRCARGRNLHLSLQDDNVFTDEMLNSVPDEMLSSPSTLTPSKPSVPDEMLSSPSTLTPSKPSSGSTSAPSILIPVELAGHFIARYALKGGLPALDRIETICTVAGPFYTRQGNPRMANVYAAVNTGVKMVRHNHYLSTQTPHLTVVPPLKFLGLDTIPMTAEEWLG